MDPISLLGIATTAFTTIKKGFELLEANYSKKNKRGQTKGAFISKSNFTN